MAAPAGQVAQAGGRKGVVGRRCGVLAAAWCLVGCSSDLKYDVDGVVRDAATGKPLEGVRIELELWNPHPHLPEWWAAPKARPKFPLTTDEEGRFHVRLVKDRRTVRRGLAQWDLEFTKSGYIREKVSISPDPHALPLKTPARMRLFISLRPGDDRPGNRRRRVPPLPAPALSP